MKNIKKHGFTLAEVLITLAIIGVVAALTIPTIISNYNKKVTLTRLQKTYTVLKNAFELAKAEHGDYSTWSWNQIPETGSKRTEYFWETYIFPYLRVSKTCFPKTDDCMAEIKHSNSMKMDYIPNTGAFVLNDGTSVLTWANSGTYYPHVWAYVDVNGNAEPNMVGKDVFAMYFSPGNPGKALGTKMKRESL